MLVCRLIGHRRQHYDGPRYYHRGCWRTPSYFRCTRCGTSDGYEVFRRGILESLTWHEIKRLSYVWRLRWRDWHEQICEDCGRPCVRFGRQVGDHRKCDVIPF